MNQAAPQPYPYLEFLPPLDYTHASVDLVTQNLLDLYRTTERDLQRRWALVVNEPSEGRQRARLTDLFASLDRSRADIEVTVRDWLLTTYPGFYAGGMRTMRDSYSTDAPAWTQPHRDAVGLLSVDTFSSLLRPTEYVPAEIKATVRELARQSTAEALLGGKTATQAGTELAQRMADRGIFGVTYSDGKFVRGSTYADMVVRTRTAIAYNAGAINQARADGVQFFEISDGAGCGLYGHNDGPEADGMIVDAETAALYPISHPSAVFAGTRFASYGGVQEMVRARYSGPGVRLTTSVRADPTTIGPNHPMLTRRGWVLAHLLREGDELVYDRREERAVVGAEQDVEEMPLTEDAFVAFRKTSPSGCAPATSDDLHGDGVFCEGEVEVVWPTRDLLVVSDADRIEQGGEGAFVGSDRASQLVTANGASTPLANGFLLAAHSVMSRSDAGLSRLGCSARRLEAQRLRERAAHAEVAQDLANGRSSDPDTCSDFVACQLLLDVQPADQFAIDASAIHRAPATPFALDVVVLHAETDAASLAIEVDDHRLAFARVLTVEQVHFEGYAFDASTDTGLYATDGYVIRNCRRSFGGRPDLTPSEVASLDVSPLQSEESQADQAAFDAFYRQENATKGSTVTQAARAFGRQERAARDLRPSRAPRAPRT